MTDPTEATDVAKWWERLKTAGADDVEKAKELCTSGKLQELAYESLDGVTTLLDAVGPFLPPPGNVAASMVSGLCKCVHGACVNNTDLEKLRDQCLDLLDLLLHLGGFYGFISTSKSSLQPPELPQVFANVMHRFIALVEKVIAHCKNYTREGIIGKSSRFFLHLWHKEEFEALTTELNGLTALAALTLGVVDTRKLKEAKDKGEAKSAELQAKPTEDASCVTPVKKERAPRATQAQPEQGRPKGSPAQGAAQLFLSYRVSETGRKRHGGDRTVPLLKSALEAHGYSVFVGESDIEGGASWAQAIKVAITDCQVFIPVCSKTYGATKWTLRELHQADKANKEILPLWHSGDYPPEPVSMYLDHVQRLPRGNQPLVQADFKSLVSDLVAAVKKAGCLPRNPPGPSNQALQGLALDQGRTRI